MPRLTKEEIEEMRRCLALGTYVPSNLIVAALDEIEALQGIVNKAAYYKKDSELVGGVWRETESRLATAVEVIRSIGNDAGGPHGGSVECQNETREKLLGMIGRHVRAFLSSLSEGTGKKGEE